MAVGTLEMLWHFTAQYAPNGSLSRFSAEELAEAVYFEGDPEVLVSALVACGWLDRSEEMGLIVHDWHEHCDDAVSRFLARRGEAFANGQNADTARLNRAEKERLERKSADAVRDNREDAHEMRTQCASDAHRMRTKCAPRARVADTDTDTDAIALADTDTDAPPGRAVCGASEKSESAFSEKSASGSPPKLPPETKCAIKELADRALVFFGKESPEKRKEWGKWFYRHWGIYVQSGGDLCDVRDLVSRIENDVNPKLAKAKGNGVIHTPDHVFPKDTTELLKKRKLRWREWP